MGYEVPQTTAVINFAGTSYAGAEVTVTLDITIDEAMRYGQLAEAGGSHEELFDAVAELLVSWNLERAGVAVPCDGDGLRSMPVPFVVAVFRGFTAALTRVVTVDDPFGNRSNDGDTSAEET